MYKKTILVLTSGGLTSALNPTLYGVIKMAKKCNYKILGGIGGWNSLLENNKIIDLTKIDIDQLKNRGGTILKTSRTNPFKIKDGIKKVKKSISNNKIDCIIAIGGDDTLSTAAKLYHEEDIPVIGLPKTIDNDLPHTYFSPGFPSAAHYTAKLIDEVREDAAYAYGRVFIIEVMGAKSGWLTCSSAVGGADIIIPPEWQFDLKKLLNLIKKKYKKNGYCVIAMSKEANIKGLKGLSDKQTDGFNTKRKEFIGLSLQNQIEKKLGYNTKTIVPMNSLQTGPPIETDKQIGIKVGEMGIKLVSKDKIGQAVVIECKKNKFVTNHIDLNNFFDKPKKMDASYFDKRLMWPSKKYMKYISKILNSKDFNNKKYQKLQMKILGK